MALAYYFRSTAKLRLSTATIALLAASIATTASAQQVNLVDASPDGLAGGGSDIVITGERASQKAAIDAKKVAIGVSDVIAADDLGKLPDASVADSLGRIPGVSVIVNQDTGEGQYVAIRGLAGTYNAYTINGVRVANTDPASRDVSLNLLPPNGLAAVVVNKTQTPDMDGDAIAGAIDFRTPTAFDFKKKTEARLYVTGGWNDRAASAGESSFLGQVQGDFAHRFADDRFGVFISADYGVSHGAGQEVENDGDWEPYHWKADGSEPIDYKTLQVPGIDLDYRRIRQERLGGNFSLDWHGDTTQLYLRGQYARLKLRGTNDTTEYYSIDDDTPRLVQVNPNDTSLAQPNGMITGVGAKGNIYGYTAGQIVDADGDGIITDADRTEPGRWSLAGRSGVWDPQEMLFGRATEVIDNDQYLGTINAGGHSDFGRLHLDYDASLSIGKQSTPNDYSIEYDTTRMGSLTWVSADPRFPHPQTTPAIDQIQYDPSLLAFDGASLERSSTRNTRLALRFDARYDFGGVLDYVKAGGKFARSHRRTLDTVLYDGDFSNTPLDGLNLEESGLIDKSVDSMLRGQYYYGAIYSRRALIDAIDAAMAANPGEISPVDAYGQNTRSTEKVYAGYALAHFKVNDLQLVAGARVEHRDTDNQFYDNDEDDDAALPVPDSTSRGYTVFLPSVTATWRPSEKQVYRLAAWTGYSAPEYGYLSGAESITRDPGTGDIVAIDRGNPDLKAARAINLDASAEYYPDPSSMVSLAGFYKHINNFIFTNEDSVSAATQSGQVEINQPQNGKVAELYGIEFDVVKSLEGLASPFDGFGIEGNITYQHSRADTGQPERMGRKIPLVNAPDLLYNLSLTFQKYGFEAKLSYAYRGKYIEQLRDNQVDKWVQHNRSVDLHTRYTFNDHLSVDFDASNLLDDWKYYTTRGPDTGYQKDYMEPGRTFLFRASYVY